MSSVLLRRLGFTLVNQFVAHHHVQLIEALDGLREVLCTFLFHESCTVIKLLTDVKNLVNNIKGWDNELKILIFIRNLIHSFQQVREDLCQVELGFVATQQLFVQLLQIKDCKRNDVY